MAIILPGVPAAVSGKQPTNADTPGSSKSGPNDLSTLLQRLNTSQTGGTSPWLVTCTGTDCVKQRTYHES